MLHLAPFAFIPALYSVLCPYRCILSISTPFFTLGVARRTAVLGSLLYLLLQTSRPANSILGRLPETREYRNVKRFPMAKEIPGIRIFRFDSSLHFANKDYFENRLKALVSAA